MLRCCCKKCNTCRVSKERLKQTSESKQKTRKRKAKAIWKNHKITICFIFLIIFLPIIIGLLYALPIPQMLMLKSGDILSYYATSLGIVGSFIAYREEKKKKEKERNIDIKPRLVFNVARNDDVYNFTVINTGKYNVYSISLFDREICSILSPNKSHSVSVKFVEMSTNSDDKNVIIDIGQYDDFVFDKNDNPKWIQVLCNDIDNHLWGLYYDILPNEKRIIYSLSECTLC